MELAEAHAMLETARVRRSAVSMPLDLDTRPASRATMQRLARPMRRIRLYSNKIQRRRMVDDYRAAVVEDTEFDDTTVTKTISERAGRGFT